MTDEEMAEEYADRTRIVDENTRVGTDCISLVQDYEGNYIDIHERIKQAFLAGLKASRPQWHTPDGSLPDEEGDYLFYLRDGEDTMYEILSVGIDGDGYMYIESHLWAITDVIAWCEIPEFK